MQLVGGNALLAGRHQVEGLQPLVQGDMAALHDRFHGDGEILPAFLFGATVHASTLCRVGMIDDAAVRTNRTIGPEQPSRTLRAASSSRK